MIRLLLLHFLLSTAFIATAGTIVVKNIDELNEANKKAQPGDVIILQNGEWKNVTIKLGCDGTKEKPITFKAQTAGKVLITGNSQLKVGGSFIIVDGLFFINGFAGEDAVINFRITKDKLANHCRVTNCAVNDFNNPKREDENNWVLFYGKNNQLDHCSFKDKKNLGVLLAVILDDDRSRENFHSINHNYFGKRIPLASNGGEIIRVGVSQHCQFNSNTQIRNNLFEYCDGETEIISIKSGSNVIEENVFKESQGSVVLRHGDNNTVRNNIFLGNGKEATGGVRVINKGQWVVNNFFYKCTGSGFRSPLAIMNGIPNSPAHRYVQVQDAVIANNTFVDCSPASFGEGSDAERSLPPTHVFLVNNLFYKTTPARDQPIYLVFDSINGISFSGNEVSKEVGQPLTNGFVKTAISIQKSGMTTFPLSNNKNNISDSLQQVAAARLQQKLNTTIGFSNLALLKKIDANAAISTGAKWFVKTDVIPKKPLPVNCKTAQDIYAQVEKNIPVEILLTGKDYIFHKPVFIGNNVIIKTNQPGFIDMHTVPGMLSLFVIKENASLELQKLQVDGSDMKAVHFVSSDSTGTSGHYSFSMNKCSLRYFDRTFGCENIFYAFASTVADKIVVDKCSFQLNKVDGFILNSEKDDKGYYNAEKITITKNIFADQQGTLLDIYRGGTDESTLGPDLNVAENSFSNCNSEKDIPLIRLTGVQKTRLFFNSFTGCNEQKILISYTDTVRARHILSRNIISHSGTVQTNNFVVNENNTIN